MDTLSNIIPDSAHLTSMSLVDAPDPKQDQTLTWLLNHKPDLDQLDQNLKDLIEIGLWAELTNTPKLICENIEDRNWLDHVYDQHTPITIGSFFIHGIHHDHKIPEHLTSIKINTPRAFGSGTHGTTHGCLELIDALYNDGFSPSTYLDIGTGSAILSIAATKKWTAEKGVATDICADSITTAQEQLELNDCAENIDLIHADGFENDAIQKYAPYDLVIANILPNPLRKMAGDIAKISSSGTYLLLSGMIEAEAQSIKVLYESHAFTHVDTKTIDEWHTLLFKKI